MRRGIRILTSFTLCLNAKGERSLLFSMQIGDDIIYDLDGISEHVISYYQHLFSDLDDCSLDLSIVWDHIPTLVTSDENTFIDLQNTRSRARFPSINYLHPDKIGEHVVSYYRHLFSDLSDSSLDLSIVWEQVTNLVTSNENASILSVPSYDEVRETIFYMDPLSASGPDGFACNFYKHC